MPRHAPEDEIEGIQVFHPDIPELHEDYDARRIAVVDEVESEHFWFVSRRQFIRSVFSKFIPKNNRILEIGAGTGSTAKGLIDDGYSNITVSDIHLRGLRFARQKGLNNVVQFDLMRTPYEAEFDTIAMFDVLEHLDEDEQALRQVNSMLDDNGTVALAVPAHEFLWNSNDVAAGHKRRYSKAELQKVMEDAGFDVILMRFYFLSIFPLLYLRHLLYSGKSEKNEAGNTVSLPPRWINTILVMINRLENRVIFSLPNFFGGSVLAIGKKRTADASSRPDSN